MLQLELSSSGLLLGLCALSLLIVLLIAGARWYLRKNKTEGDGLPAWSKAKHLTFDPLRHNNAFFQVGLIASLALTLLAFNWTQHEHQPNFTMDFEVIDDVIEMAPPRTTTPPPTIPPPPTVIEAIPEDELIEEAEDFVDQTINWNDEIIPIKTTSDPKPLPVKPPTPVIEEEVEVEEIFVRVEKMPAFPGCEDMGTQEEAIKCTEQNVMSFIYKNLKYPSVARENGVEGTVVISFIINKQGKITDVQLMRDIGAGCGEATKKTIEKLQEQITFSPGMQQSKPVQVRYNLPIRFKLQN